MCVPRRPVIGILFALVSACSDVFAHHSTAAIYDRDGIIEIEGEISRVFWANPHVRIWITVDGNQTWEIESSPLRRLDSSGVTSDLFNEGDIIRVAGNPGRRGGQIVYAQNILLPDGRETLMGFDNSPLWSDRIVDYEAQSTPLAVDGVEAEEPSSGIFRVWTRSGGQQWSVSRTTAAAAAVTQWDLLTDDPRLRCEAPGMVDAMASGYPIELMQEGDDIVVRMEEWDAGRVIHMNEQITEIDVPATPMGYSVGSWEGSALIVSTKFISWPYLDNVGTPQSSDVEVVEQFTLSGDETRMSWVATITDSINLTEPATVRQEYEWVPGERIQPFDCQLPSE